MKESNDAVLQRVWKRIKPMTGPDHVSLVIDDQGSLMFLTSSQRRLLATHIKSETDLRRALAGILADSQGLANYMCGVYTGQKELHNAFETAQELHVGGVSHSCKVQWLVDNGSRLTLLNLTPVTALTPPASSGEGFVGKTGSTVAESMVPGIIPEFIPSLGRGTEINYYYSLLPRTDEGNYAEINSEHVDQDTWLSVDVEVEDPDEVVPTMLKKSIAQDESVMANANSRQIRKANPTQEVGHACLECGTTTSPEWRKGPNGSKTLCNACGLRYSKWLRQK